ncbi:MAG TPA: SPW repeat protein [Usitatibacter sp.]|nr:SPW repeat protein [Usitatibacter sp.]
MKCRLWECGVTIAAAAWLAASPFVLGFASFGHAGAWYAGVIALLLFASATEAIELPDPLDDWVEIVLGLAMMGAPWILGVDEPVAASFSFLATGLVVAICGLASLHSDTGGAGPRRRAAPG